MTEPDPALLLLLEEVTALRQSIQDILRHAPEEVQLHRIHGMYVGHILDIRKTLMQEQAADKEALLIDALRAVVRFLLDEGEDGMAQFVGDHLEAIGEKVKETWQDSKAFPDWPTATPTSAAASPAPSPRSDAPAPSIKRSGGNGRAGN
ncbi:hypothetical protein [Nitrospina watsonii]|uniref:Uncharacterized protein n=1 Tax=Nitrospina watsonii TaxID=1323948 RepID=A0ABM9HI62_9BACT|nr:hypothetical protein [Nitrospina watsonii]CAI2719752.1 conserved protein of unknown function [Nitrospina watsonii]